MRNGTTALLLIWLAIVYVAWTWYWPVAAGISVIGLLLVTLWSNGGQNA